jgi:two-component system cell cycle sensor histidine kinase/response regulator CckA
VTIVLACTDQLSRRLPPGDPARDEVGDIRAAAERVASLTRALLVGARHEAPAPDVVDLHDLLAGFGGLLRRVLGGRVRLELSMGANVAFVRGDRRDLEQALMNLAINARDAMPDGGLLAITTADAREPERAGATDEPGRPRLEVTIRDTGVGMDDETRRRAFDPFFTTKSAGSGLGLSRVAGIVEGVGGSITLETSAGHGATFRILLPVA